MKIFQILSCLCLCLTLSNCGIIGAAAGTATRVASVALDVAAIASHAV